MNKFASTKINCVMVQDGSNSNLKSKYDIVNEFAMKHQKRIDDFTKKFTPEMIVVCEIPPIFNNEMQILTLKYLLKRYLKR